MPSILPGSFLLVVLLLAVAFVLGLLSLQRTREIVSEDFQQQQLILAKTTARQIEDGLEFLRRELKILNYSPAIQYLKQVAWANRMKVSFDDLSKLGVTAIVRMDFYEQRADRAHLLDANGGRITDQDFDNSPEVIWARDTPLTAAASIKGRWNCSNRETTRYLSLPWLHRYMK